jgi:hypothetical protein
MIRKHRLSRDVDAMVTVPFSSDAGDSLFGNSPSFAFVDIITKSTEGLAAGGQTEPQRSTFLDRNYLNRSLVTIQKRLGLLIQPTSIFRTAEWVMI